MAKFLLDLLLFFSVCFFSNSGKKVGCSFYEKTGQVVAGGNGGGPGLNQFSTERFYVDDSQNIYLLDQSPSNTCEWRFLVWPANSSQARLITNFCTNGASPSLHDVLVSPDGKYKITDFDINRNVVYQVRYVNGQNGVMFWSKAIVDNDKNIYAIVYANNPERFELRKWTPAHSSSQDGIFIDLSIFKWGISSFFVDSSGSVYVVGPNYVGVKKWTNGKITLLMRNQSLTHPTSVLVDDEENIYIGELNQITLWPAKSDKSFPVVQINRSNGPLLNYYYRNIIGMDNDGSLYLLSTDQALSATQILKYKCDYCSPCISNNRFTAVRYAGVYGPQHNGEIKLSDYTGWSDLVNSGKATKDERAIISGMAVNEGNLDSVQAYDSVIVSAGAMQKIVSISGGGEFEVQVYEFQQENPQAYNKLFEKCGWSVSPKKIISFKGETGSILKQYLREGFTKGSNDISEALGPLVCAISSPEFQLKQIKDFITRLRLVLKIIPIDFKYTIGDYFKSHLGQATALDQHVNLPALVKKDVSTALNNFYKKNGNAPTNPNDWTVQQRSTYEREILEDYGLHRTMTDPENRYKRLKTGFPLP